MPAETPVRRRRLVVTLFKRAVTNWLDDKARRLAASLAFFTMLSIGPLLLITLRVVGLILGPEAARGHLEGYFREMVGPRGAMLLEEVLAEAGRNETGTVATFVSLGILVFTASYVFAELHDAMNTVWGVTGKRSSGIWTTIRTRLLSFAMVLSLTFLLLVSLIISSALAVISMHFMPEPGLIGQVADFFVSIALISGIFALLFKYVPDVTIKWRHVWPGAVLTAVLFTVGQTVLALYLGAAFAVSLYGAAGSLVALMLWVFYSAQIVFFGAEFTKTYTHWRTGRVH